ncbi:MULTISPECIES: hypothetical protein [unclassified Streptomyces]|uniref:hypothetical protein n=1 Tax=unclassified Streptomyces TaxID=2593676 RepID=UPI002365D984|nr:MULTISPECIES: hypothetical protein [unclassified Streptomyces]MDF3143269.1 hypothetical protein [Streptomyces sp. T21Q-yed]WDF39515.1 hypothetical protein PBV52_23285 [Streptomyces sp. T12]
MGFDRQDSDQQGFDQQGFDQQGFDGPVAWDTPGTRRALHRWTAWHLAKSLGWVALWVGALYLTLLLPTAAVVAMVPVLVVLAILAVLALGRLSTGWRMRRILAVYPWRRQSGAVRITKGKDALFVLPDPDSPGTTVSLKAAAGLFRSWSREALKDYDAELRYAGDPRFACVVAKPGLRGLGCLAQPTAYGSRTSPRRKGLSSEARRRARAIGARVAD